MSGPGAVAVVGLGLIGGSLARDLAARGVRVLGHDAEPASLASAREAGVVHATLGPGGEGIEAADAVVLAVPVRQAHALLQRLRPRLAGARLVMDVGSTKAPILATAARLGLAERFVGAHPLCGDHRAGWAAGRAGLFEGERVYLCRAGAADGALELARALWAAVGAECEEMEAAAHDRRLAWTSHLPQAASTALTLALQGAGITPAQLGPGGQGMTRLAGSSPAMWSGIVLENAASLAPALAALEARLAELREATAAGDAAGVERWFRAGREWKGSVDCGLRIAE